MDRRLSARNEPPADFDSGSYGYASAVQITWGQPTESVAPIAPPGTAVLVQPHLRDLHDSKVRASCANLTDLSIGWQEIVVSATRIIRLSTVSHVALPSAIVRNVVRANVATAVGIVAIVPVVPCTPVQLTFRSDLPTLTAHNRERSSALPERIKLQRSRSVTATHDPSPTADPTATDDARRSHSRSRSIGSGFRIVSVATFLSRVLGLVRDMAMAAVFGAGPLMDAFTVAFRVPNLVRRMLGEGALTAAFLPVFVREHERDGLDGANRLVTAGTLALGGTLLGVAIVVELLLALLAVSLPPGSEGRMLVILTAEMLPYAVLICIAAHFGAVLQSLGQFFWPALIPVILNVIWIAAIAVIPPLIDQPELQIQWIAGSVVAAGVCQLIAVTIAVQRAGVRFAPQWRQAAPQVQEVVRAMVPVVLATSVAQLNSLLDGLLAWGLAAPPMEESPGGFAWPLESGTASALYFAQRMYQFPLGVFGVALGTVLFPLLSRHTERGELDRVGHDITLGIRLTLAIGLPASVGLVLLREPIAASLFERGAFTSDDAALTARCIAAYGAGVWASVGLLIIHRGFFVRGDRQTPVKYGMWAVGLNVVLNLALLWVFAGAGLALATSLATIAQFLLTAAAYQRQTRLLNLDAIGRAATRTIFATIVMGVTCAAVLAALPSAETLSARIVALLFPLAAATSAYLLTAKLVGLDEPFVLLRRDVDEAS